MGLRRKKNDAVEQDEVIETEDEGLDDDHDRKRGKKGKKGRGKKRRPVDVSARVAGSVAGLLVVGWTGWQLLNGELSINDTPVRVAVVAIAVLATEVVLVPLFRVVVGAPHNRQAEGDDAPVPAPAK